MWAAVAVARLGVLAVNPEGASGLGGDQGVECSTLETVPCHSPSAGEVAARG